MLFPPLFRRVVATVVSSSPVSSVTGTVAPAAELTSGRRPRTTRTPGSPRWPPNATATLRSPSLPPSRSADLRRFLRPAPDSIKPRRRHPDLRRAPETTPGRSVPLQRSVSAPSGHCQHHATVAPSSSSHCAFIFLNFVFFAMYCIFASHFCFIAFWSCPCLKAI